MRVYDELKYMSDQDLAERVVGYLDIMKEIFSQHQEGKFQKMKAMYHELKTAMCEDAHHLGLVRNQWPKRIFYNFYIRPFIMQAAAHLRAKVNDDVSEITDSVYEARIDFTFSLSYEEWKAIASGEKVVS